MVLVKKKDPFSNDLLLKLQIKSCIKPIDITVHSQGAREGFDWAQKLTRPKYVFSGRELPREQRFIVSFRRVRQGHVSDFEKKLLGYLVKIENG